MLVECELGQFETLTFIAKQFISAFQIWAFRISAFSFHPPPSILLGP
jgi:hypothetical protein